MHSPGGPTGDPGRGGPGRGTCRERGEPPGRVVWCGALALTGRSRAVHHPPVA